LLKFLLGKAFPQDRDAAAALVRRTTPGEVLDLAWDYI
jgi:hypothetical protein